MSDSRLLRKYRGETCLNCEHPLDVSDKYCPNCSQINTNKKLSIGDIFNEFFASIVSYDSRLRNTLSALLFKPGKITKEYCEGKRQRYTNPFRFYLSVSIIFFILYGFTLNLDDVGQFFETNNKDAETFTIDISDPKNELEKVDPKSLDSLIAAKRERDTITYKDIYLPEPELDKLGFFKEAKTRIDIYEKFYDETKIKYASNALDSLKHTKSWYNNYLYEKSTQIHDITQNFSSLVSYFIGKLPFIIFFYLPVFALFIWLLYVRHSYTYMEHLIFLFHSQSLFFVLFSLALLLSFLGLGDIVFQIGTLLFLFYLYKAMRKFYDQSRLKTIIKFIILNFVFLVLAFIGGIFALLVSFATY